MSFLIAVHVNEGIVLASDRRTTYTNTQTRGDTIIQRIGIHTTNSTDKTFPCPNGAGISTCGDASLLGKPITGFIQDMIRSRIGDDCPVSSIPQVIIDYFNELPLVPDTHFIVAGYDKTESGKQQLLYKVRVKEKSIDQKVPKGQSIKLDEIFDDIKKIPLNRSQRRNMPKNMDNPAELRDVIKGPALVVLPIAVYQ